MKPATPEAVELFRCGAIELARVESNGIRIDTDYLDRTIIETTARIKRIEAKLRDCDEFKIQRRLFGGKVNLTSRPQLARVLFDEMGHESRSTTDKGNRQLDETALEKIGTRYCTGFLLLEKLRKIKSTYLGGIRSETVGGFLHPFFDLHTVLTFRGSSSKPNFQNIPTRDPQFAEIVRRAFIPRDGHVLLEMDLKANEVRMACIYTGDPKLTDDTLNGDMHGDMAAEIFCLNRVPKNVRQEVKSKFVFAQFFGDYWKKCAANLWEAAEKYKLTTDGGVLLTDHLRSCGIDELGDVEDNHPVEGTFLRHLKGIEDDFWNVRYKVYNKWKQDFYAEYCRNGWYRMKTGFVVQGVYSENQITNGPIQGSAFHCLLWVLIQLGQWLRKHKMKSLIIGTIHDSIELDCHKPELEDVCQEARRLFVEAIRRAWPWVSIPLGVEAEVGHENWYEMTEVALAA